MRLLALASAVLVASAPASAAADAEDWTTAKDMIAECRTGTSEQVDFCQIYIMITVLTLSDNGANFCKLPSVDEGQPADEHRRDFQTKVAEPVYQWIASRPDLLNGPPEKSLAPAVTALWSCS